MVKRWMNTGVIAIAIIILIGVTQVYAANVEVETKGSGTEVAELEQLLHTADAVIKHADQWVIKWQVAGHGDARMQAMKLAADLGLEAPVQDVQTGHDVYRSEGKVGVSESPIGLLLNVASTEQDEYYVIVQLAGRAKLDRQALLALHGQVAEAMTEHDLNEASWNMSVQGKLSEMNEGNDITSTIDASSPVQAGAEIKASEQLAALEAKLSDELEMIAVERYEDGATASVSYQATELPLEIMSGSHLLNMQLAVHQVSGQNDARVTVGFPVITIEY
ncbi:YwmB family TATA-box binding protein [Paenibacillus cucumis (ex Kampfer et al. 2016)]|uniref:YwmB family TATA-box binding protein n=1 Tax=Paenibacillus cucumis (ex Kampfer et al. 2016) TaxID=1776858 RepID=A0ABS7KNJ0_9BACL|nr:YwmB family TATA-box binding protein [Paenibacillus cucumis (ex Kampfer et al. 2016)]MBY0205496.1 YwmB family TATA-box binding protein [Paenibacillus cucumis (ex Kampfer et al. 2016)]